MLNRLFFLFFLFIFLCTMGCNKAAYCIKIEGGLGKYGIDDASVELCRDPVASQQQNAEVYISNTGQSFVIVQQKYLDYANKIISKNEDNQSHSIKNLHIKMKQDDSK